MSLVVLQRGHVPRTSGRTGAPGEQEYAIRTADVTAHALAQIGHIPKIIDADPPFDSAYRGDYFFALHWDGSTNPTVSGASVGYQTVEGARLAVAWKRHYKEGGWTRAFKPDNYTDALRGYYGVRKAIGQGNRFAIITEAGFVTNSHDKAMMSPELTALAIVNTVVEFAGGMHPVQRREEEMPYLVKTPGAPETYLVIGFDRQWINTDGAMTEIKREYGADLRMNPNGTPLVWPEWRVSTLRPLRTVDNRYPVNPLYNTEV